MVNSLTQIESLEARLEYQKAQLRDLTTMGAVIASIHELDAVLSVMMDMSMGLVNAEVGLTIVYDGDHEAARISWGVSEEFVRSLRYKDNKDLATYCLEHREPIVLTDLGIKSDEGITLNTVMALPIQTSSKCLGLVVLFNKTDSTNFGDEDREILELLLSFVAVAVDNALLIKEQLLRQKIEQEIAIAKQVQETILPQSIHEITGAEIGAVYYPARDVGGDFYDILKVDDDTFVVILGDVSNKGIPAALVMSACSGIIKSIVSKNPHISMSELACDINEILASGIIKDREMFVTLFFCKFEVAKHRLTYCNAGHLPGLYWDSITNEIDELGIGGPIVGQFPGIRFKEAERPLTSGDRLFLFTDGLTEAMDSEGHLFGRERAEQVFSAELDLSPKDFCVRVKEWIDRYTEGAAEDTHDDFTILQVKVH